MIEVFKLDPEATIPTRNNSTDSGLDLYSLIDVDIPVGATVKIPTGIAVHIAPGQVGKIEDRSGLALKGLRTGGGVIDPGYSGDVSVVMHNFSAMSDLLGNKYGDMQSVYRISKGDKIAQLLIYPVVTMPAVEVKHQLWSSDRGSKGFGSSDRH
jgi:dUTP pyrophosphatase